MKSKGVVKKRKQFKLLKAILFLTLLLLSLALILYFCLMQKPEEKNENETGSNTGIANPASVHCIENNGTLEIRSDDAGNQYGVCIKDGKECEEWAFFRGECVL